jgi:hypothetical protein
MPIKVSCHCGQSFMAKDELKGQTLLCPKCHQPLTIGEEQQAAAGRRGSGIDDLLDEAGVQAVGGPPCPRCGAPLKPNAVLCIECGYHLETGEKIAAAKIRKSGERGHGEAAEDLLERAAERIAEDKLEERKTRKQGLPAWIYLVMLVLLVGFAISMFMIPKDQAFLISGFVIIGFSSLYSTYLGIRIIIVAFSESLTCGLLYLFLPFYPLYYIFTRWDQVGAFFLLQIAAGIVSSIGWGIVSLAPMMAEKEGAGQVWHQLRNARPAVIAAAEDRCDFSAAPAATRGS